jgi:predicted small secreted protein
MESNVVIWAWAEHNQGFLTVIGIIITIVMGLIVKSSITKNKQIAKNNGINANNSKFNNVGNGRK